MQCQGVGREETLRARWLMWLHLRLCEGTDANHIGVLYYYKVCVYYRAMERRPEPELLVGWR